jgi:hypothetical protein
MFILSTLDDTEQGIPTEPIKEQIGRLSGPELALQTHYQMVTIRLAIHRLCATHPRCYFVAIVLNTLFGS